MDRSSFRLNFWAVIRGCFGFLPDIKLKTLKVRQKKKCQQAPSLNSFYDLSDEIFDTAFEVNVIIKGLDESKLITLDEYSAINRTRHLKCTGNVCEEFTIMHLAWLEFSHYQLNVNFYGLNHKRYNINKLNFYVSPNNKKSRQTIMQSFKLSHDIFYR